MSEPWLETWHVGSAGYIYDEPDESKSCIAIALMFTNSRGEATRLVAAAPDMCRALLRIEKQDGPHHCSCCLLQNEPGGCWLNEALTKCGLATQEQRDAARRKLGL